jgi:hypothetical protein
MLIDDTFNSCHCSHVQGQKRACACFIDQVRSLQRKHYFVALRIRPDKAELRNLIFEC